MRLMRPSMISVSPIRMEMILQKKYWQTKIIISLRSQPMPKNQIKRDLKKWEVRAENSRTNGSKGGRPTKPTKPSGLIKNPVGKKEPVTVNVTVTVIDNVIKEKRPLFEKWLTYRKEIKKPIKVESTLNALIKKFNSEPIEKIQVVVTTSIENGWTGLFWDKIKQQNNGQQISTAKALDKLING